jgi:hypothetical protein
VARPWDRVVFDPYNIVNESNLAEGVRNLAAYRPLDPGEPRRVVVLPELPEPENEHGSSTISDGSA